ncbi:Conserved oligomeric Golgi complex subunit 5 [Smittium culicis]|uniref:Conserved oligomeric Golgi complex subunit 5 n=1 Tax=Smittium culicis TaxID=133412 RepID=A0A1R1YSX0_9FUNG|nr:Conserved oligomeric Golgi complex subunit 5 [Smittium culicis]
MNSVDSLPHSPEDFDPDYSDFLSSSFSGFDYITKNIPQLLPQLAQFSPENALSHSESPVLPYKSTKNEHTLHNQHSALKIVQISPLNSSLLEPDFNSIKTHINLLSNKIEESYFQHISNNRIELLGHFTGLGRLEEIIETAKARSSDSKAEIQKLNLQISQPLSQMQTFLNRLINLRKTLDILKSVSKVVLLVKRLLSHIPTSMLNAHSDLENVSSDKIAYKNETDIQYLTFSAIIIADIDKTCNLSDLLNINIISSLIVNFVDPRRSFILNEASNHIEIGLDSQRMLDLGVGLQIYFNLGLLKQKGPDLVKDIVSNSISQIYGKINFDTLEKIFNVSKSKNSSFSKPNSSSSDHSNEFVSEISDVLWNDIRIIINSCALQSSKVALLERVLSNKKFSSKDAYYDQVATSSDEYVNFLSIISSSLDNSSVINFWWNDISNAINTELLKIKGFFFFCFYFQYTEYPTIWTSFLSIYPRFYQLLSSSLRPSFGPQSDKLVFETILTSVQDEYLSIVKSRLFSTLAKCLSFNQTANQNRSTNFNQNKSNQPKSKSNTNTFSWNSSIGFSLYDYNKSEDSTYIDMDDYYNPNDKSQSVITLDLNLSISVLKSIEVELEMVSLFEPIFLKVSEISQKIVYHIVDITFFRLNMILNTGNIFAELIPSNSTNDDFYKFKPASSLTAASNHINFLTSLVYHLARIGLKDSSDKTKAHMTNILGSNNKFSENITAGHNSSLYTQQNTKLMQTKFYSIFQDTIESTLLSLKSTIYTIASSPSKLIISEMLKILGPKNSLEYLHFNSGTKPGPNNSTNTSDSLSKYFEDLSSLIKRCFFSLTDNFIMTVKSPFITQPVINILKTLFSTFVSVGCTITPITESINLQLVSFASNLEFECLQLFNSLTSRESYILSLAILNTDTNQIEFDDLNNDFNQLVLDLIEYFDFDSSSNNKLRKSFKGKRSISIYKLNQIGKSYGAFRSFRQLVFNSNDEMIRPLVNCISSQNSISRTIPIDSELVFDETVKSFPLLNDFVKYDLINHLLSRSATLIYKQINEPENKTSSSFSMDSLKKFTDAIFSTDSFKVPISTSLFGELGIFFPFIFDSEILENDHIYIDQLRINEELNLRAKWVMYLSILSICSVDSELDMFDSKLYINLTEQFYNLLGTKKAGNKDFSVSFPVKYGDPSKLLSFTFPNKHKSVSASKKNIKIDSPAETHNSLGVEYLISLAICIFIASGVKSI